METIIYLTIYLFGLQCSRYTPQLSLYRASYLSKVTNFHTITKLARHTDGEFFKRSAMAILRTVIFTNRQLLVHFQTS